MPSLVRRRRWGCCRHVGPAAKGPTAASEEETKWYYERLCGSLSFWSRQLICGALYEALMKKSKNIECVLHLVLTVLEEVVLTAKDFPGLEKEVFGIKSKYAREFFAKPWHYREVYLAAVSGRKRKSKRRKKKKKNTKRNCPLKIT